ncbi:MAG TPA: hypothetical protein VK576_01370, partial [Thermoleophilia bacterium]|nr:hypothetical protein [Thermoleophilia bacterium]
AAAALDRTISTQAAAAGLPVSTVVPNPSTTAVAAAGVAPAAWARANAATFARAVQPRFFAPTLPATRLGVSYYQRLLTSVRVVSPAAAAGVATRLMAMGYAAAPGDDPGLPHELWPMVYYRSGERTAALGLAGDLGLSPSQTAEAATAPAGLTLVMP